MSLNLLDMLKDQVTGQLANQASSFLGESESSVTKALGGIFPAVLGSMIGGAKDESGAAGIMDLIKGVDGDMLGNIGGLFGGGASSVNGLLNSGGGILNTLLGDKMGGMVDMISKVSGLKSGSTSSLMKMAAPFLMGIIGKQISGKGIGGLMDLLKGQKDHVSNALPSGMGSLLGLGFADGMKDMVSDAAGAATGAVKDVAGAASGLAKDAVGTAGNVAGSAANAAGEAASTGLGWIKWALPFLVIGGIAWWLWQGGTDKITDAAGSAVEMTKDAANATAGAVGDAASATAGAVGDAANATAGAVGDAAGAMGDMVSAAWSKVDATAKAAMDKITFTAGSAGAQMKDYISGGFKGDSNFTFNNLNFDSGSAMIKDGTEIDNLAAILKAYPEVKVTINGYTDNTGDAAKNKTLSSARAASVMGRLAGAGGIDISRIKAVGHGDANPVASNDTAEGRAQNRRIEISINK